MMIGSSCIAGSDFTRLEELEAVSIAGQAEVEHHAVEAHRAQLVERLLGRLATAVISTSSCAMSSIMLSRCVSSSSTTSSRFDLLDR